MGKVTEGKIAMWKKQYGEVYSMIVKPASEGEPELVGYFRKPDLTILSAAMSTSDIIKTGTILFDNCWLDGDDAINHSDEAKLGIIKELAQLFKPRVVELKKL